MNHIYFHVIFMFPLFFLFLFYIFSLVIFLKKIWPLTSKTSKTQIKFKIHDFTQMENCFSLYMLAPLFSPSKCFSLLSLSIIYSAILCDVFYAMCYVLWHSTRQNKTRVHLMANKVKLLKTATNPKMYEKIYKCHAVDGQIKRQNTEKKNN